MKYTQEELENILKSIEYGLMETTGINTVSRVKTDTTDWTVEDFEREIAKMKQTILTNMNAFSIPKVIINEEN